MKVNVVCALTVPKYYFRRLTFISNIFESAKSSLRSSAMTSPSIFKTGKDETFCLNDVSASVNFAFISTDVTL